MSETDLRTRKLDRVFGIYASSDGVITADSYAAYIDRIRTEFGWEQDDPRFVALRDQLHQQWAFLLATAGSDGVVTRAAHHALMGAMIDQSVASGDTSAFDATATQWFALLDRDGDGKVGVADFQIFLNIDNLPHVAAAAVLAPFDGDDDEHVTEAEMVLAHQEFWVSNDPDAKGNQLLGAL